MAEYIDKQAAIDAVCTLLDNWLYDSWREHIEVEQELRKLPAAEVFTREALDNAYMHGHTAAEDEYREALRKLQSAEAGKAVRCKDCKRWRSDIPTNLSIFGKRWEYCQTIKDMMPEDGWCSMGEAIFK